MPYNSFMPNSYNPYVQQYQQMLQPQPQQQQNNGLTWVQGIEGAKSHFVSPGQSALLMDSESNSFFIKTADASGMPLPLRVFDYKERTAQQAPQQPTVAVTDTSGYITREEFEARIAEITATTERTDINAE
ncbi:hypothetical protein [Ruminococcus flavefaciens]|uniref:hypothetical protein n=1 Tax=Ruminococcus flavefaciens TaxID=1265 RepID=UPI0026EAA759|nr:hypothetical protein [Ruminococcus flavefaciens]